MSSANLHVAVVDDEESVRVALGRMLRWAGLEAATFASGDEFIASSQRPDCVVLDLHMPVMSGFEVLARLAAEDVHPPVVVITGHDTPENRERATIAGAVAYLRKPVDGKTLVDAINAAVSNQASLDQTKQPPMLP